MDEFAKMIIVSRVGIPYPILFEILPLQCMIVTVQNSTILFCLTLEKFRIYRATKAKSVHKNDQHVQGWNPDNLLFSKIEHNGE